MYSPLRLASPSAVHQKSVSPPNGARRVHVRPKDVLDPIYVSLRFMPHDIWRTINAGPSCLSVVSFCLMSESIATNLAL